MAGQIIGVDVGGTFTDLIELGEDGRVRLSKVPSTLDNQAFGVLNAIEAVGADLTTTRLLIHGTTTTTNAVLERKLSKTGLITTRGFRDVLELGRRTRPQAYGMTGTFTPIIPRDLRLEVPERMLASGAVHHPLDEKAVANAVRALVAQGCEALLIHFLHAYANPAHELRAGEIAAEIWPNAHITLGHKVLSESREYERGVTAAINASVQPLLQRYVSKLEQELAGRGFGGAFLVMNGNGGMVAASQVAEDAAKTVMSGPASGVMAAAFSGRVAGFPDLLTYDMGGTSTDVALIRKAEPGVSNEIELEYAMPIHVPMVDVRTIGAGGGSIARVNTAGLLEVGPDSAGARPGPICYGQGGELPTISDANFLLGRLKPPVGKGAKDTLDKDVRSIFKAKLADPLGLDVETAAEAVLQVANTKMAGAIRMVSVSLGVDPRDFALFAFGGAGPLHAAALAAELGVPKVLVPGRPGLTNAIGCVVADLRQDFVQTLNRPLDAIKTEDLSAVFAAQIAAGRAAISAGGISPDAIETRHSVDMQFVGQTHLLRVTLETANPDRATLENLFAKAYAKRFGLTLEGVAVNLVNANTSVIGKRPSLDLSALIDPKDRRETTAQAETGTREIYLGGTWQRARVFWRDFLPLDCEIHGPALIEQMDTTILIPSGDVARGDRHGNLIIEIGGGSDA